MSDAPTWQDFFDAAKAEMYSQRPDLSWEEGDITEMIASGVGAVGDRLVGWAAEEFKNTYVDGAKAAKLTALAQDHWNLARDPAAKAVGTVTITRSVGSLAAGTIDAGSIVAIEQAADGTDVQFVTQTAQVWSSSETGSKDVAIEASEGGRAGNVGAGEITRIVSTLFDPTFTVTNAERTSGGGEEQTDESYREDIRGYAATLRRGTLDAIEYGAKEVDGVVNATAADLGPALVSLYVSDVDGYSNAAMLAAVNEEMEAWRAGGITVSVYGGTPYTLTISIALTVKAGFDTVAIAYAAKVAIVARLNKLRIGETCTRDMIKQAAMNVSEGITACSVTLPATDVAPIAAQVIRTAVGNITVS